MKRNETPLEIGMLLYPGLTLLDLIGPETCFSWHANTRLVWKTTDPIVSDTGIHIHPTCTFETCPSELDILFVPGGLGQQEHMNDAAVLAFLSARGASAKYVTSVCGGSLLLGAAGLLKGYRATSHWTAREALRAFGAEPVDARVVVDRNRITAGGITAGIDFGLQLLAKLRGNEAAQLMQLVMEYDPAPPFNSGTPKTADPALVQEAMQLVSEAMGELAS
jgi:cyclohexyl-isocyanide hydratase